ncbi:hypothetical protein G5C60_35905 [Streptomyces sp. HC44]|uniref:Integral membrane protein n=1 Tax=Streptomyces scabichelini TaxID=2711217 RepID=A0A6G4VFD5_9ACTN|nr:hypothetical protein [Streptomyces scabichelini]
MRRDLYAAVAAALLFATAAVVGHAIENSDGTLHLAWAPLYAWWSPQVGPGTPAAITVAVAVIAYGPGVAARLPWRALVPAAWVTAMAWTWSLALIDGWYYGIARRLTTRYEYLQVIDRFDDIGATLRSFTQHILIDSPDHWPPHTAGHPPAATLTFVWLDRIGLGGGGWAGVFCITVGASAAAAVLVAVRALTDEALARRAAPFLALAPAAVWVGTSADGYFAAVAAWAVALLALAVTGTGRTRARAAVALASGLLFGLTVYLSYGLTLFAIIAATVLLLTWRQWPPALFVPLLAGVAVVPVAFTLAGFNWWEGYRLLVERYYQGAGGFRPYWYFVWANLACTVLLVGPATVAGLRRTLTTVPGACRRVRAGVPTTTDRLVGLVVAGLLMVLAADLSGMSKAETERIWLPFAFWLLPATALLPRGGQRGWLAAQVMVALTVNHLFHTGW